MENRKTEKIKTYEMLKEKIFEKRFLDRYEESYRFLHSHQEEWKVLEDLIRYHENFSLNEKVLKANGILDAIYYFYLEDTKEESLKYLKHPTEESNMRIACDQLLLKELEKNYSLYSKILAAKEECKRLEKRLSKTKMESIKSSIEKEKVSIEGEQASFQK